MLKALLGRLLQAKPAAKKGGMSAEQKAKLRSEYIGWGGSEKQAPSGNFFLNIIIGAAPSSFQTGNAHVHGRHRSPSDLSSPSEPVHVIFSQITYELHAKREGQSSLVRF